MFLYFVQHRLSFFHFHHEIRKEKKKRNGKREAQRTPEHTYKIKKDLRIILENWKTWKSVWVFIYLFFCVFCYYIWFRFFSSHAIISCSNSLTVVSSPLDKFSNTHTLTHLWTNEICSFFWNIAGNALFL